MVDGLRLVFDGDWKRVWRGDYGLEVHGTRISKTACYEKPKKKDSRGYWMANGHGNQYWQYEVWDSVEKRRLGVKLSLDAALELLGEYVQGIEVRGCMD